MQTFERWRELQDHAMRVTDGRSLYSGQGIYHFTNGITILKSVDGTHYYDDNLENPEEIIYTLKGQIGNQDIYDRDNYKLLNEVRTIYIFRVRGTTQKEWIWYGEYELHGGLTEKEHPDAAGQPRRIYQVTLRRV
jgi:hypothetical protein